MRRLMLLAVSAAALGLGGCSALGRKVFQNPVVNLRNVRVNGLGLNGGTLDVELAVYNPNGYTLDASRMTYQVQLDTIPVATGIVDQQYSFRSSDTTVVRIPVNFTYRGIGEAGRQLLNTGAVNYRVNGDVTVGTPIGNYTVPYRASGRYTAFGGAAR